MTTVNSIAVIGAGTMGSGIAITAALNGLETFQVDVNQEQLDRARAYHAKTLARNVEKAQMLYDLIDGKCEKKCHPACSECTDNKEFCTACNDQDREPDENGKCVCKDKHFEKEGRCVACSSLNSDRCTGESAAPTRCKPSIRSADFTWLPSSCT